MAPPLLLNISPSGVGRYFVPAGTRYFCRHGQKYPKAPEGTSGSFTSGRAMHFLILILYTTRLRKIFCNVSLSNRLCTSAAAADSHNEQPFWFYRCVA